MSQALSAEIFKLEEILYQKGLFQTSKQIRVMYANALQTEIKLEQANERLQWATGEMARMQNEIDELKNSVVYVPAEIP